MSILALVATVAFATSNKNFQAGQNAQFRDQGSAYIQQQIEKIKNVDSTGGLTNLVSTVHTSPFCIYSDGTVQTNPAMCKASNITSGGDSDFTITSTYDSNSLTFTVNVKWRGNSTVDQSTTAYYKASQSYTACPSGGPCSVNPPPTKTPDTAPPTAGITLYVNGSSSTISVVYGSVVNLTWSTSNVQTGTCSGSGPGFAGAKPDNSLAPVPSSPLTPAGAPTAVAFALSCTAFDLTTKSWTVSVNVSAPPVPSVAVGSASSITTNSATLNGTVNPNGYATTYYFKYGTSTAYGSTTSVNSAGAGTSGVGASGAAGGLSPGTTYHFQVCATNAFGTVCSSDNTFTTTNPPPSFYSYGASPGSICYGCGSTIYWGASYATGCNYGGASGSFWTGGLTGNTGYTIVCSGPGGSNSVYIVVYVSPPPPPPPPSCSAWAGTSGGGPYFLSAGGGGCSYYMDTVVGWNGGFSGWGPTWSNCHTQYAGADPWGWLASGSAC